MKGKGKDQEGTSHLERPFSLFPLEPLGLQDLDFHMKFEQTLFKSNFETNLKENIIDHIKFQSYLLESLWKDLERTAKT